MKTYRIESNIKTTRTYNAPDAIREALKAQSFTIWEEDGKGNEWKIAEKWLTDETAWVNNAIKRVKAFDRLQNMEFVPCFEQAVALMDDDLREQVHAEDPGSDKAFLDRYMELHQEKYGEEFSWR